MQKYGLRANEHADHDWSCEVCGQNAGFNWSDLHGEGMCNSCGTPYMIKEDGKPCNLKEEWLEAAKDYWSETKQYMGLGSIMIWRDYPECKSGVESFYGWIEQNRPHLADQDE